MRTRIPFIFLITLASALSARAALVPAPDDQEEPSVAANGNSYFVVWADKRNYNSTEYDIYGVRISSTGEVLDPGGIAICTDPGRQTSPRVAFDGERYLVVWEDDRESTSAFQLYQIYGARVGTSGQVLDPNGFKITTNRVTRLGPAVVSNGHGFFVAWEDWHRADGAISDVYGSPVSSDGVVANSDGIPLVLGAGWQVQPRLAFANGEYLMTYRDNGPLGGPDIWGIRISIAGQTISSAFRISNSNDESGGRYGLASNGRDCLVVWGDHRGSPSGFGYPKIYGTLVHSNGVVATPNGIPIATNALYQDRPRIASDGNDFLVVWQESNDAHAEFTDIYGAKLTGAGVVGAPARIAVNQAPGVQFNPDVAFSSASYLVAWQDGRSAPNNTYPLGAFDVHGSLISGGGVVSGENGFLITAAPSNRPPVVSIVAPTDGAAFTAPATVTLIAHANDQDGDFTIQTVEFFTNNVSLGVRTNYATMNPIGPFFLVWTNVPIGEYALKATATDDRGAQTTSSPVNITVRSGRPVVNVTAVKADAYELGDGKSRALIFQVTRTGPIDFDLLVSYRVGGTAQNGLDYEALSGRLIVPAGATRASVLTYARSDGIFEGDETVEVAIERPSCDEIFPPPRECYEVGEHGAARGFIHDAPALLPVVSLELVDAGAAETLIFQNNIDWAEFRVLRTGDLTRELVVFLNTQQGTARLGEDYQLVGVNDGSTVRMPAGTNVVNVRLYPIDDDFYEGDETVFFHLIAPPFGSPLPDQYDIDPTHSSVAMVIHDNDPISTRLDIISPRNGQQFQPGDSIELRAQIVGTGSSNLWIVEFFEGDHRLGTTRPGTPIWWSDAPAGRHVISARAVDAQGAVLTSVPSATIQVGPGAALPVVKISADSWRTGEPCPTCRVAPGIFTIERTAPTNTALTVFLAIDGTATADDDYQAIPARVEIPAGQRSVQLTLLARDDQLAEGPEVVRVRVLPQPPPLLPPTYFVNVHAAESFVVIFDDEPNAPQARLDIVAPTNGSHLAFPSTVQISALAVYTQNEVFGPVEFYDGDRLVARSDVDAAARPAIPGLPSVHTAYWTDPPIGQHVLTARTRLSFDQSITSPAVNVTVDSPLFPVVRLETIPLQNPQAPEFCPPNADCAYPSFVVRRSGPTNVDLRVYLSYSGTAAAGLDYPAFPDSLVIPAGRDAASLMLVPKDDMLVEGSETVVARFTPVPGPGYVQDPEHTSATITILDNERPVENVVGIEATQRIAEESSEPFRRMNLVGAFTVSRTGPTNQPLHVFVGYSGTALPGVDYPALPGLVTIPAGAVSTTIHVVPNNDHVPEGIETVVATLSHCGPGTDPATGITCVEGFDVDPAHESATVFVRDDGITTASLMITRPKDGAVFSTGDTIHIEAVAIDLDGYISRIEFWDGDTKIGASEVVFIRAPDPGTPIQHSFEWQRAAAGPHTLTARTILADGTAVQSPPVHITVGSLSPTDREFHAISIYSGVSPNGGPSRNNEQGQAAVVVNRPGKKITLFLSSYEPVWWHLTVGNATILEKVILGGYYRQEIDGIGAEVEIINAYYDEGHGTSNYLWPGTSPDSGRFFRVLQKLCDLVGMDFASFQGSYTAPYPTPMVIDQVQNDPRLRCDYPQPVEPSQVPPLSFHLDFHDGENNSGVFSQNYTLQGMVNGSRLLPTWRVVTDAQGRYFYGADFHRFWKVDSMNNAVQELAIPPGLPAFSWPVGIAFDSLRNRILVATLVGEGYLYGYSPSSGELSLVRSLENRDLDSLVYHAADDSLYGVTTAYYDGGAPSLLRLNANGEVTGEIPLPVQPYGVGTGGSRSELASVGEYLVLLLETGDWIVENGRPEKRIYLIDPRNGQVWLTFRRVEPPPNRPPTVTMLTPSDGATFNAGADILLGASVTDPDGNVANAKVEFFANGTKIGDAAGPNTSQASWVFKWSNVAAGDYTLTAKATDTFGASANSAPVRIKVRSVTPLVRIEATGPVAEEDSGPLDRLPFTGVFTFSRTGPTNGPLSIFAQYSGTATPGVDYPDLPFIVTIPAGAVSTAIKVVPNGDQIPEGIETLVATISNCPPLTDPPLGIPCFAGEIDPAHQQATVFIRDDGTTTASLTITRPRDGAAFASETPILIEAVAIDLNGYISWVEFWDGDQKLGDSIIDFFIAPDPGTPIDHSLAWRNASPGPHVLTARAIRADGSVLRSAPVHITVGLGSLPTVDVAVRDAFAVEPRTNADLDSATFSIRRVGPTNADLVVSYSLQGTAANGIDYEKLSGEAVILAGRRFVNVNIRPLPDNLTEQDESVILRLEDSPGAQPPRYFVGLQRRAVAIISDNASAPSSAGTQYLSLANGLPHICFAAESGRTYRIEASSDLRHWENVGVATASGGALHFVDPAATNIRCRFYRLAAEPIGFNDE